MQSIYRFRKADVGLLPARRRRTASARCAKTPLPCRATTGSCPAVVDWINASFPAVSGDRRSAARRDRYREFVATRDALRSPAS